MFGGIAGPEAGPRQPPGSSSGSPPPGPAVTLADRRRLPRRRDGDRRRRLLGGGDLRRGRRRSPPPSRCSPGSATSTPSILVFNLLPAFPLDGGRIARAIVWKLTGDRERATSFAARLGQGFALPVHRARHRPAAQRRRLHRHLAGADRLDARPVGARDRRPQPAQPEARRPPRRRRDGRRAGRDPLRHHGRAGRSTSTSCATAGPGSRSSTPPSSFVGLLNRGTADSVPETSRTSRTVSDLLGEQAGAGSEHDDQLVRSDAPIEIAARQHRAAPPRRARGRRRRRQADRRGHARAGRPGAARSGRHRGRADRDDPRRPSAP